MSKQVKNLTILFWTIILSRFIFTVFLPLTDTTEARYANTALIMAKINDWITPYYDYHVPFWGKPPLAFWFQALSWGKPPLAFWFQALSYKIFGIADFVPRFPSLLITLATAWLIYKLLITFYNKTTAMLAIVIYSSMSLVYALSGAVITDPYLTFGTTLSLVSFLMVINNHKKYWNYLFFVGTGLGILTKGPLALAIVGGVITLWILLSFKKRITMLKSFPWIRGIILMLLISVPWYLIAEHKTPGFLYYFIVGENLSRFIDTGWHGDKYGYVHKHFRGVIWIMWLIASLPWGVSALVIGYRNIINKVLPSLPGFAIVLALYLNREDGKYLENYKKFIRINSFFIPVVSLIALFYILYNPSSVKTEKFLIAKYKSISNNVNKDDLPKIKNEGLKKIFTSDKYVLYEGKQE